MNHLEKYCEDREATFAKKGYRGLNIKGRAKFFFILQKNKNTLKSFYAKAIDQKECYIGPFIGEFGNFLLHVVPFLSHLYSKGVKIHFCGLHLHQPFLLNEKGQEIIFDFTVLRDFFAEAKPTGNKIEGLPEDVKKDIKLFVSKARKSNYPYLNIFENRNLYWYSFRNWQLKGKQRVFNLARVYGAVKSNKVVVFPRKMKEEFTKNNGARWDYEALGELLSGSFEEVVFIGHPEFSNNNKSKNSKVKYKLSGDNRDVLEECSTAKLIITQHSGAMHVGGYVHTPVLLIFKGDPPIKGLDDSIRFRVNFDYNDVEIAFNDEQILQKLTHDFSNE